MVEKFDYILQSWDTANESGERNDVHRRAATQPNHPANNRLGCLLTVGH
jgi:hypothetical protein